MSRRVSIKDVAEKAKVSAMTVSRVINQHPRVTPETAQKVQAVIAELGYTALPSLRKPGRPSSAHKGIHAGQVAMVIMGMAGEIVHSPVIERTIYGIRQALQEQGLSLLVVTVEDPEKLPDILDRKSIDGMITTGTQAGRLFRDRLSDIPQVCVYNFGESDPKDGVDHILPDNEEVSRLAAKAFIAKGLSHCAYFDPSPGHPEFAERGKVFRTWMEKWGGRVDYYGEAKKLKLGLDSEPDVNREQFDQLISTFLEHREGVQGIFLPSDLVTAIFHRRLREEGVSPSDFVMVSCNAEKPYLESLYPQPTSIDIHAELIGEKAVEQLMKRLVDRGAVAQKVTVKPELME